MDCAALLTSNHQANSLISCNIAICQACFMASMFPG